MDAARDPPRGTAASNRDGLLALVLAQLTLLTLVAATALNAPGMLVMVAYASALVVGLPAFVVGAGLLAPGFD
ncbi:MULTISPECIES: hypothetical protein [Halobacterium]|uniref:hypothetical protein n=1 Tax=Halobacterium TaxID=2239 RepID=UPI00073F09EE|nr:MULTISPECIES: hypothetical protein [Halobacterium]MCG1003020.1 hypothetical protein [Halobacterium noricense]